MSFLLSKASRIVAAAILILLSALNYQTYASHNAGGQLTYKFLNQANGYNPYEIILKITADIQNGNEYAIREENPATIGIFRANGATFLIDSSINMLSSADIPIVKAGCQIPLETSFKEIIFTRVYTLPANEWSQSHRYAQVLSWNIRPYVSRWKRRTPEEDPETVILKKRTNQRYPTPLLSYAQISLSLFLYGKNRYLCPDS